ncbi:MAG: SusC/RagA family TonB-linked outer membrane protein [Prevotella sp.]|nr:SusC/RagA family TonB-linked outer membrane protein [Prevotella sp.]
MKYHLNHIIGALVTSLLPMTTVEAQPATDSLSAARQTQMAWKNTAAVSTVTSDRLLKTTSPSVGNALHGLLPGLTVLQTNGEPGNDFSVQNLYSRGRSSFVGSQQMLVIVDGFESTLDYLSAAEIESVSLLKDAAALALYGGRGANGVLVVTTKKGRLASPEIAIRLQTGIQTPTVKPEPVSSYDYARLYNQALVNDGLAPRYGEEALGAYANGSNPYLYPQVNWRDELLKNSAPMLNAEMSFRGGSNVIRYYVMAGLMQNEGLFKGTDSKRKENSNAHFLRLNFRANLDVQVNEALMASLYAGGAIMDKTSPGGSYSAYNIINSIWATPPNAFPVKNPDGTWGGNAGFTNPVGDLLGRGLNKENARTLQVIFQLKYDFKKMIKGLSLTAGIGYNNFVADTSPKRRSYARYALAANGVDAQNNPLYTYTQYGVDEPLTASEGFRTDNSRINLKVQADYQRSFGGHDVEASLFFLSDLYKEYGVRDDLRYLNYAGRVAYSYNKTYIAEVAASYMGNDNFAPGKRYALFPTASLGWVVSNENFMQKVTWLDYLKLRASYGVVGNDQTAGRYLFDVRYSGRGSYLFGVGNQTSSGFSETSLPNTEVTWERKKILNVGLEARVLKKLTVGLEYFNELHQDILTLPNSSVLGFVGASYGNILPLMNIGKVKNHGMEFTARYDGTIAKKVNYFVEAGTWFARSRVEEMGENLKSYDYLYGKGNAVGRPIVLVADRLYQASDFEADGTLKANHAIPQYGMVKPGDIKYVDQNGDQMIDGNDSYPVGYSALPEWNYSFRLGFQYKGFDVDALFHGVANRDLYINGTPLYSFYKNSTASALALDSWTADNTDAAYPRLSTVNFDNNYRTSTYWRRNGSYLRLRNLLVGYTLPASISKAVRLGSIYAYFNAVNLFTIDHLDGLGDPEMGVNANYPLMRNYHIGLKLSF